MSGEWRELPIGDVATVIGGGTPSTKDEGNFNGSIPWLTPKDLSGYPYRYISRGERNISEKGLMSSSARLLPEGAVLLTTRAPVGYVAIASNSVTTNQGFRSLVLQEGFHPEFVYYLLKSKTDLLKAHASGTTFGELSGTTLKELRFMFPPLPEQHAIATILGALDDKIELNRRMNQTLEVIAQTLFKSWFSDFEPFRDQGMEESPMGPIPRGWEIKVLDDLTNFVLGGDWGKDDLQEDATEPAYCIRGADIPDLQHAGVGKMPIRYLKPSSLGKRSLCVGDIVIEISGGSPTQSTGRTILVTSQLLDRLDHSLVCSNFCRLIRLRPDISPNFVYYWLRRLYETDVLLKYETGTTSIKNFAYTIFSNTHHLVLPPAEVLNAFGKQVQPLLTKHTYNGVESESLANIRDSLLPKLLSGEIRIKDAEKFVEVKI